MIVLDYLKTTKDDKLVIPPFQTGHLGLLPDTEVHACLLAPAQEQVKHAEVLISPYAPQPDSLARLSCTMRDQPGVVERLVRAITDLEVNIDSQESSGVNY